MWTLEEEEMTPLAHQWRTDWVGEGKQGEKPEDTTILQARDGSSLDEGGIREIERCGPLEIYLGGPKSQLALPGWPWTWPEHKVRVSGVLCRLNWIELPMNPLLSRWKYSVPSAKGPTFTAHHHQQVVAASLEFGKPKLEYVGARTFSPTEQRSPSGVGGRSYLFGASWHQVTYPTFWTLQGSTGFHVRTKDSTWIGVPQIACPEPQASESPVLLAKNTDSWGLV